MSAKIDDILAAARRHCNEIIRPGVDHWNAVRQWPRAASDKAAAEGLLGLYAPAEWGGQGLSLATASASTKNWARATAHMPSRLSMHNICTFAVCGFGSDALKRAGHAISLQAANWPISR